MRGGNYYGNTKDFHHDYYGNSLGGKAAWLVEHSYFEWFISILIVFSAIQMGIEADLPHDARYAQVWDVLQVCDTFLVLTFFVEMVLKIVAYWWEYFYDSWNWLDFFVCWMSIFSLVMVPILEAAGSGSLEGFDVTRTFRLLRLIRMAKMMKAIPELMMVMEGLVASMKSMIWVFLLLFLVVYVMAIYCVENIGRPNSGEYLFDSNLTMIKQKSENYEVFNSYEFFGSIPRAMVTLFSITLVAEWQEVVRPVFESQQYHIPIFVLLVVITSFGIVNVIIGVICEKTNESMRQMEKLKEDAARNGQCELIDQLSEVLFEMDVDADGKVSVEEFVKCGDTHLSVQFGDVKLPMGFTWEDLHMMLDDDGSGHLSKQEFVDGMYRIIIGNEFQRACSVQLMMGQIKHSAHEIKENIASFAERIVAIKGLVAKRPPPSQRGPSTLAAAPREVKVRSAGVGRSSQYWIGGAPASAAATPALAPADEDLDEMWRQAEGDRQEADRILAQAHEEQRSLHEEQEQLAREADELHEERKGPAGAPWRAVREERRALHDDRLRLQAEREETMRSLDQAEAERKQVEGKWQTVVRERDQVRDAWRGLRTEFSRAEERWKRDGGHPPPHDAPRQ